MAEIPDRVQRLFVDLEDDVRSFLLQRLPWSKISDDERKRLRDLGVDVKRLRRPSFLRVTPVHDASPSGAAPSGCNVGAEGVMAHVDEHIVHLVFKCGEPDHNYHYSMFGVDTIVALAKACEGAWPGSVMEPMIKHFFESQGEDLDEDFDEEDDELYL